jgi:hypothetical protein
MTMNDTLHDFITHAEQDTHRLAELVWAAAHQACARLTRDLPEAIAHELADLHLEETLAALGSDTRQQIRFLMNTLGEAEAQRRLALTFTSEAVTAA